MVPLLPLGVFHLVVGERVMEDEHQRLPVHGHVFALDDLLVVAVSHLGADIAGLGVAALDEQVPARLTRIPPAFPMHVVLLSLAGLGPGRDVIGVRGQRPGA